jgi:SpoVK/Ycf46/Vps4 family AAA+-type ATPase
VLSVGMDTKKKVETILRRCCNCSQYKFYNVGKTTSARIISRSTKLPLIYVPLESILSKWYGESERNLAKLFDLCNKLGKSYGGSILFIDEVDALASSR